MKFPDSREMRQAKSAGRSVRFGSQTSSVVVWGRQHRRVTKAGHFKPKGSFTPQASWAVGTKGVCGGAAFPEGGELGAADTAVLGKPTQARLQRSRNAAQTAAQGEAGADSPEGRGQVRALRGKWAGLPGGGRLGIGPRGWAGPASREESPGGPRARSRRRGHGGGARVLRRAVQRLRRSRPWSWAVGGCYSEPRRQQEAECWACRCRSRAGAAAGAVDRAAGSGAGGGARGR